MACARTVAVVVPSPAVSDVLLATSRTICAPMFSSGSFSSISFATVAPSLVMVGEPNFLSSTTFRPLGPSVTFTASASWLTPRRIACRDCSPYTICFAIDRLLKCQVTSNFLLLGFLHLSALDDTEHFVLAHDEVFLPIKLDLLAGILAEQDEVAGRYVERHELAVVLRLALADGDDFALLGLFLGGVGDDDPADFLFAFFNTRDDDAVVQRSDVHALYSVCLSWRCP